MKEEHLLKQISGWHYVYAIVILVLAIIALVSYKFSNCDSLVALISFAATVSSIILSVLAIFMTVLSGESMNKLRDSMIGLQSIPSDVKTAVISTIDDMKKSSEELNRATEASNETIEKLNQAVSAKMTELEKHVLNRLDSHQAATLRAINERNLTNLQGDNMGQEDIPDNIMERFISTTSNSSLAFLYIYGVYCKKRKEYGWETYPVVNLKDIVSIISVGKDDNGLSMYFLACLVLLSSFGLLDYEMQDGQYSEVTFLSINEKLVERIPEEFEKRKMPPPSEKFDQYIDSLFNDKKEDKNDGSEAN